MTNWKNALDKINGADKMLEIMGVSRYDISSSTNPVLEALKDKDTMDRLAELPAGIFNLTNMSKLATLCQMVVFDSIGGPERDGKRKALRRHWYSWYKGEFAQPLSQYVGEDLQDERWGLNWAGRLSTTYAWFVDEAKVTYRELWVEDASRMMKSFWDRLFEDCHIILAVEKDSLFEDFTAAARAMGARSVYSGKGKSSKAAIEKVLRDHFNWTEDSNPFDRNPLIVLHISDHDYDGDAVIGPCFAEQARRYTDNVLEARVGVKPDQVTDCGYDVQDKWYQIKVNNSSAVTWAADKAMFLAECVDCGNNWPVVGDKNRGWTMWGTEAHRCPECDGPAVAIEVGKRGDRAYGFEVEAMRTRDYYGLIVDALLQVLPFEDILDALRDECRADVWEAARIVKARILKRNESYADLLAEFERLEDIKNRFEREVEYRAQRLGQQFRDAWRDAEADPEPEDFRTYVEDANGHGGPWRPFDQSIRTRFLANRVTYGAKATVEEFVEYDLNWESR